MTANDPSTLIPGAVLSDGDIKRVVSQGIISIKVPRNEESKDFEKDFINAMEIDPGTLEVMREIPPGCLEAAGYSMNPGAYKDGSNYILIDRGGYVLKPNQHAVIRTLQHIKLPKDFCALHFGLHRNQMAGVSIGSGLIQPEWGPAPLYVTIWNSSRNNFIIRREEAISRLVFLKMTSGNVTGRFTSVSEVREAGLEPRSVHDAKEREDRKRTLLIEGGGMVLVLIALFILPLVIPSLNTGSLSSTYREVLVAVLGLLLGIILTTYRGFSR